MRILNTKTNVIGTVIDIDETKASFTVQYSDNSVEIFCLYDIQTDEDPTGFLVRL